jgi:excisionase family DNA binding protein
MPADANILAQILEQLRLLRFQVAPLMRVIDAADILGVSVKTVQRLIRSGELKAITFGDGAHRLYRISPQALEEFIARKETPPTAGAKHERGFFVPD